MNKRKPSHPGMILKHHYMDPLHLTVTEVSGAISVSRKTLSGIINGRAPITTEIALRLSKAFGTSAELWLNLQLNYTLWETAHTSKTWKRIRSFKMQPLPA